MISDSLSLAVFAEQLCIDCTNNACTTTVLKILWHCYDTLHKTCLAFLFLAVVEVCSSESKSFVVFDIHLILTMDLGIRYYVIQELFQFRGKQNQLQSINFPKQYVCFTSYTLSPKKLGCVPDGYSFSTLCRAEGL